jgi:putative ABC transport system substrate-binding protein
MQRRKFITLLGGAAAGWPFAARAQQPAMPVIGFLSAGVPEAEANLVGALRQGLGEVGIVEGQNVRIEYRWARNDNSRLAELAAELVRRGVAVIYTPSSTPAGLAAKAATTTIPIVFSTGADPVQVGLVSSLNRPGGNVTGVGGMTAEVEAKRIGLLHELLPRARNFALLVNLKNALSRALVPVAQASAAAIGLQLEIFNASTNGEIDTVFASFANKRIEALTVGPDTLFITRRTQLITLAIRYVVPAIYPFREDAVAGGLLSYGTSQTDNARLAGVYTGRVLKGEKPADLPVQQATKFEFVVNLQTAKTLGIEIPPPLLANADEVIE